mgnify:FL=1
MKPYNWTVRYSFGPLNDESSNKSDIQVEADTPMEARRIARPIVKKLGGTIYRVERHNAHS